MPSRLRLALVGAGQMGRIHARAITASDRASLELIIDRDRTQAVALAEPLGVEASEDLQLALHCDAAVVAAPTSAHLEIAKTLLQAGVPTLVEKPLAHDWQSVEQLTELARATQTPLMCGFVERFNPVVQTARDVITSRPIHMVAQRHSPPANRVEVGVIEDLLIHDLDLAVQFLGGKVDVVGATALRPSNRIVDEVVDCTLLFAAGSASLSASRLSQQKVRRAVIATEKELVELDLLRQTITVFQHVSQSIGLGGGASYRSQTIVDIPFVRRAGEPVALQFDHFLDLATDVASLEREIELLLPAHQLARDIMRDAHRCDLAFATNA